MNMNMNINTNLLTRKRKRNNNNNLPASKRFKANKKKLHLKINTM